MDARSTADKDDNGRLDRDAEGTGIVVSRADVTLAATSAARALSLIGVTPFSI
jgi:hypothetical protein